MVGKGESRSGVETMLGRPSKEPLVPIAEILNVRRSALDGVDGCAQVVF